MTTTFPALPGSGSAFRRLVQKRLHQQDRTRFAFHRNGDLNRISAVLFLMAHGPDGAPLLILNKRSHRVRQPGDLCCPGGSVAPVLDRWVARWLRLPTSPLYRWPQAGWWRRHRRRDWQKLSLLLATALREGMEEMRLNPLGVAFLGPLPVQRLVLFDRLIYPLVGWVNRQQRFFPNWEVERVVRIPVAALLDAHNYARFRLSFTIGEPGDADLRERDMPCFIHRRNGREELLWGATYRITEQFLTTVFDFVPPATAALPVVYRQLDRSYLDGGGTP